MMKLAHVAAKPYWSEHSQLEPGITRFTFFALRTSAVNGATQAHIRRALKREQDDPSRTSKLYMQR